MNVLLLVLVLATGLLMIPFGLPGTWILAGAAVGYSILVPGSIGMVTVVLVAVMALIGELIEFYFTAKFIKRYGGSSRASWGAILGGMVGALIGVPIPLIGSVIGALAGAFVGAFAAELSRGSEGGVATRVATGALVARAVSSATKVGIGLAMAAWILFAAVV